MKTLREATISPDGKWAAFVQGVPIMEEEKSEYRDHIWLVPTKGGKPIQLTNGPNGDNGPEWSPDSTRIAFISKRSGDKKQIWIISIAGGEAKQLTYAKNGASRPKWSPDGKKIAFLMQEEHKVDCLDLWAGMEPGRVKTTIVSLGAVPESAFRFFENHHFLFQA